MKRKTKHKRIPKRIMRTYSRKRSEFEKITDLTVNLSTMTVATSAGLALMKGSKEALKR